MSTKIKLLPIKKDLKNNQENNTYVDRPVDNSFLRNMNSAGAGIVIPVYTNMKGEKRVVMLAHSEGRKKGVLDFPGGRREKNETYYKTAARECREETCELLQIRELDLVESPGFGMQKVAAFFVIDVPLLRNTDFQHNLEIEKATKNRHDYLEMEHLVRVPVEHFKINEYPRKGLTVTVHGKEYKISSFAAIAGFIAARKKLI